jgi:hypothetical protein
MKTILSILIYGVIFGGLLAMITVYFYWLGKRTTKRAMEYEKLYPRIQKVIHEWEVNRNSYCVILKLIDRLQNLKYKNPEMTRALKSELKADRVYLMTSEK